MSEYHKQYYLKNRESIRQSQAEYYKQNRYKICQYYRNKYNEKKIVNFGQVIGKPQEIKLTLKFD